MSIKIQCRLRLPYIIRLKEEKDYEREFSFTEFEFFKMTLLFNDPSYEDIYLAEFDRKSCQFIQLEVISSKYNYQDYKVNKVKKIISGKTIHEEFDVEKVPETVEFEIMRDISPKVNQIIKFIREKSSMFWLENISINPTSNMLGVFTAYYFYAPTARIDRVMKRTITTVDNYMESDSGVGGSKIFDHFFDNFETFEEDKYSISYQFLDKAKSSLYDLKINEAIVFAAIAQESFISKYIEDNSPSSDIVFDKLNEINGHLMDLKYNIILKHLKGKSLKEINEGFWNTISGIYKLRNGIMHSGEIKPTHLSESGFANLNFKTLRNALNRIEKVFKEIKKL